MSKAEACSILGVSSDKYDLEGLRRSYRASVVAVTNPATEVSRHDSSAVLS